jgi:hypothetical protein
LDTRFCSICNSRRHDGEHGQTHSAVDDASLSEILQFLNHEQVRATYGAVAEMLGVIPRSMGARLGPRHAEASWIVSAATGLPTHYGKHEVHPALLRKREIITSGIVLKKRLSVWKSERRD